MDTEAALQTVEQLLKEYATEVKQPEQNRLDFSISVENLLEAIKTLKANQWGYLSFITGLDHPAPLTAEGEAPTEGNLEVLYHFAQGAAVATLRISLPYSKAEVPSVCGLIPSASLYERELMEMFGVNVVGTPDPRRLLLPDDWPEGVYPLRKSYQMVGGAAEPPVET